MKLTLGPTLFLLAVGAMVPLAVAAEPAPVAIEAEQGTDHLPRRQGPGRQVQHRPDVAKPYFWPLNAPGDVPVTRAWPMVKGVPVSRPTIRIRNRPGSATATSFPKGSSSRTRSRASTASISGRKREGHGNIVCTEVGTPKLDKNHGQVATKNEWRTADGTKILDETRTIHLYDFGEARLLVLDIDLHASAAAITFGDTKEGSFGVRINDAIREAAARKRARASWRTPTARSARSASGASHRRGATTPAPIDGKTVGLAIFDDPNNPPEACWHSRGYGLMAANPFGRDKSFPAHEGQHRAGQAGQGRAPEAALRHAAARRRRQGRQGGGVLRKFVKLKS